MKNEELNLVELLKDCPKGTKLYSPICGEVEFVDTKCRYTPKYPITTRNNSHNYYFTKEGYYSTDGTPECLLFPSKDQRDWNVWKAEQKKKYQYQVGDYITLSKNQLSAYFDKIIDSDFGIFKIVEKNKTQFTAHYVDAETIQPICIGIDFLETIPFCKVDKFDPKWLKPFDKVLVRTLNDIGNYEPYIYTWNIEYFGYIDFDSNEYHTISGTWKQCIPYNAETKHLIGTTEKAPEFYINWEK